MIWSQTLNAAIKVLNCKSVNLFLARTRTKRIHGLPIFFLFWKSNLLQVQTLIVLSFKVFPFRFPSEVSVKNSWPVSGRGDSESDKGVEFDP
jgi:hypothetical protein